MYTIMRTYACVDICVGGCVGVRVLMFSLFVSREYNKSFCCVYLCDTVLGPIYYSYLKRTIILSYTVERGFQT